MLKRRFFFIDSEYKNNVGAKALIDCKWSENSGVKSFINSGKWENVGAQTFIDSEWQDKSIVLNMETNSRCD